MATILRGRHKGKTVTLAQWCNDWFTVNEYPSEIFSPTNFQFTWKEMEEILAHKNNGVLLKLFQATGNLQFKRRL